MFKIFVEPNDLFLNEVKYIWTIFAFNKGINFIFIDSKDTSDISIGGDSDYTINVSNEFYKLLWEEKYFHTFHFKDKCMIEVAGKPDYLSTAFYMISCIQEINHSRHDEFNRFPYAESYQCKFNNVTQNLVQDCFDKLYESIEILRTIPVKKTKTAIFLSHDIDIIYGSILQDSYHLLKKGKVVGFTEMILKNMMRYPYWLNMIEIMDIESKYGFKSTFFWLVNKGRVSANLSNSDYDINNSKVRATMREIEKRGFFNGLHKSAANTGFDEELKTLNLLNINSNRYHYVKFNPSIDFKNIEDAGIKLDCTLGFAEGPGFRNSYGMPYRPYNLKERRAFNFVECPLNIMDTTFHHYKKSGADAAYKFSVKDKLSEDLVANKPAFMDVK